MVGRVALQVLACEVLLFQNFEIILVTSIKSCLEYWCEHTCFAVVLFCSCFLMGENAINLPIISVKQKSVTSICISVFSGT